MKGELIVWSTGQRNAKTGSWMLKAKDRKPHDLDGQIIEIFEKLPNDQAVWDELARRFDVDMFCGLFMDETCGGFGLSVEALSLLATRHIKFELCLYGPFTEDDEDEPVPPRDPC